jgi:hypothetical protein
MGNRYNPGQHWHPGANNMNGHPDNGMYSVKLIHPEHLNNGPLFIPGTLDEGVPHLMNFSNRGNTPAVAANIPLHHKALVYVTSPMKKFIWAIEYLGTVAAGQQVAAAHPNLMPASSPVWSENLIPIRFLATVDPANAPDAQAILQEAGVEFTPPQAPMQYISAENYQSIFDVIEWDWVAP